MYGDGFFHGMGGGMWLGPLIMFGLPLLIVVLVVWWLMDTPRTNRGPDPRKDARALLDERFARGEIDEDEYRRRREAIGS
jgi:putative membrane protein